MVNETLDQLAQRVALQMMDPDDGRVEWGAWHWLPFLPTENR